MRRREFIAGLTGTAAWPLAAPAQQLAMPVIGYLRAGGQPEADELEGFRHGLIERGYVENRNVAIEFHTSAQYDRLPAMAADVVRREVAVILANGLPAALAAKAATSTTPIIFQIGGDPVAAGLVTSLSRPGGNLTGATNFSGDLLQKRLELLRELVPSAAIVAILVNPSNPNFETRLRAIRQASHDVGQQISFLNAGNESEIVRAFAELVQQRAAALVVSDDPFFFSRRNQLVMLAALHRVPAIYSSRLFVGAGGLVSYGDDRSDRQRLVGLYVGRVLRGDNPADLPVQQPTKLELLVNAKTARMLGLEVPPSVLVRADEVIE